MKHDRARLLSVTLSLGGSHPGRLILDPDGARVECTEAGLLWNDRDAGGSPSPNEEFEYRLGTLATYVGVVRDPDHRGQVKAAWGEVELLRLQVVVVEPDGSLLPAMQLVVEYPVRPEAGEPEAPIRAGNT